MRILYHHRTASRDGQAVHIDELIAAFRRRGHEVRVVGPAAGEEMEFGDENRLVAALKKRLPGAVYELLELAYSFVTAIRLRRELRRFKPDLFYERYNLFSPAGAWLRGRHALPYLLEVNAPLAEERLRYGNLKLARLAAWSERFVWRRADRALPVTDVLADHLRAAGVAEERIVVIPNGIDPRRFEAVGDTARRRRALGVADSLVLGFTGFIRAWHGLDEVIEALPQLDASVAVLIVGDGPGRGPLERLAGKLGVAGRVHFTGLVERHDIAACVACFDIALQPSVTPYASPLKLFEYMASGCAIVAPKTPNIEEILTDGVSARLFDPDAPGALRDALIALCADEQARARLAAAAKDRIVSGRLTWDDNAQRIEQLTAQVAVELT